MSKQQPQPQPQPQQQQPPFQLLSTADLRQKEHDIIHQHFPQEVVERWIVDWNDEKSAAVKVNNALQNELKQVKTTHVLYQQQGNLFYPSDYQTVKTSSTAPQHVSRGHLELSQWEGDDEWVVCWVVCF